MPAQAMDVEQPGVEPSLHFDIHGLVRLRVSSRCRSVGRFRETFGPFQCPGLETVDITVGEQRQPLRGASRLKWQYRYTDAGVESVEQRWTIHRQDGGFAVQGEGDLLPLVLPLVDRLLVERGAALVHAAAAAVDGRGVCLPAAGGTGKTSAVAMLARLDGAAFMADDFAILTAAGQLLAFPKRIWMKSHHRQVYERGFRLERRLALPYRFTQRRLAPLALPLMRAYPKLREWVKRHSPVLMAVPTAPAEALGVQVADAAPLRCLVFLESYEGEEPHRELLDVSVAVSRLVGQFYSDVLVRESQSVLAVLAATGLVPIDRHLREKSEVLLRAIAAAPPAHLLRLPAGLSRQAAATLVVAAVTDLLEPIAAA